MTHVLADPVGITVLCYWQTPSGIIPWHDILWQISHSSRVECI